MYVSKRSGMDHTVLPAKDTLYSRKSLYVALAIEWHRHIGLIYVTVVYGQETISMLYGMMSYCAKLTVMLFI